MMNFSLGFRTTHNALASAVVYDKQTGVTTTQQTNVNGNWSVVGEYKLIHAPRQGYPMETTE